jgi:3-oxoacyl-[acyl-carrier protein] reductase
MATAVLPLENKKVLITGASRGIGAALAETLALAGADVVLLARDGAKLAEVASRINTRGGRAIFVVGDVADAEASAAAVKEAQRSLGDIDVLVNAAGIQPPIGLFAENCLEAWERTIQVNLMGPVRVIHAVLPGMRVRRQGKIINFSGGGATGPRPRFSAYAASKAALVRLTETLAVELEPYNIQVNAVAPGAVNTQMLDEVLDAGEKAGAEYHQAQERVRNGGTPVELACELVLFLSSPASGDITGKLISAPHDPWKEWAGKADKLNDTPLYTLRRLDPFTINTLLKI